MIGKTISHYEVLEKLGEGGMGVVYKALDTRLNRHVAIKFLPSHLQADPQAKTRFVHEARAASALNHANIAVVHEIDETPDHQLFIVMALYEGRTLKHRLAAGALTVDEAIAIVSQLASGISTAHDKGILHRDIKPANILMGDDGHAKLADFGLARLAGQTRVTRTGWTVGTVAYMSPEQARGGEIDQRSDIFSLGVVLYELLTGKLPFPGDHEAAVLYGIMNSDPTPLADHREGLPSELQRIVSKALSRDPDSRYQTAADLRADLQRLSTGANVDASGSGSGRRSKARKFLSLVIIVLVVAAGVVGYRHFAGNRLDNPAPGNDARLVIAVAPFWGQNADALEEGKVMQALVERHLVEELASDRSVAIVGKKRIIEAPESDDDAKALGRQLGATIVLWGEVLVLRGEVEIQPYVTLVKWVHSTEDWDIEGMQTSLQGPDQLSLRKAKAEDVGQLVLQVAGTFYRKKDPDKALAMLQKIFPPTPESLMEEGLVHCDRGNWSKSEELLSQAVELAPDEALPYSRMATLYRSKGDHNSAIQWSRKAIEVDSTFTYSYAMIGSDLTRLRKYEDAIQWLESTIARFPQSYMVQANMGFAYFRKQEYDVAEVWSDRCINVARGAWELSDAYAFKGTVLQAQGRLDESEHWFEKAIEEDAEQWYAYNRMGIISYKKQDYEEAIRWFKQVAQLGPTHVHSQLPQSYMILGRYAEAAQCLRWMLDIRPRDSYSAVMYTICLYRMGEHEKAREFIARQANALDNDAWRAPVVRFFAGQATEAAVLKAAEADPETENQRKCEAYYFLGVSRLLGVPAGVEPDTTLAMKYFENCVSTGVTRFMEYKLAARILAAR